MGLTDKISEYYRKADDFILEKHIRIADWANCNFGKTNYETSSYAAFSPVVPFTILGLYQAAHQHFLTAIYGFALAAGSFYYQNNVRKANEEIQRREELSLESMTADPYVSEKKLDAKKHRFIGIMLGIAAIPLYKVFGSDFLPYFLLVSGSFFGPASVYYFRSIDYFPPRKGRIVKAITNAVPSFLRKPALEQSGG